MSGVKCNKKIYILIVALVLCIMLGACQNEKEQVPDQGNIKLGVLLDFSGANKADSDALFAAMQMAVDEINTVGVLEDKKKIELVKKDDAGDCMQSVAGYYQLVQEGVCAVIGTNNAIGMEHLISASANSNVPVITPVVSNDTIVDASNFCFQSGYADAYLAKAYVSFACSFLKADKVATIFSKDKTEFSNLPNNHKDRFLSLYEDFSEAVLNSELELSYAEELKEVEYNAVLKAFDKIIDNQTDMVFVAVSPDDMENIVLPAARSKGYTGAFFGTMEMININDTSDYDIYVPVGLAKDNPKEYVQTFIDNLSKYITSADITTDVRAAYEAVYILRDAMEAGYLATSTSIALKLPFLEGSLLLGEYEMGAYGNLSKSLDFVLKNNLSVTYMTTIFE